MHIIADNSGGFLQCLHWHRIMTVCLRGIRFEKQNKSVREAGGINQLVFFAILIM